MKNEKIEKCYSGTTLVAVQHRGRVAIAADSMVSWGYHPTDTAYQKIHGIFPYVYCGITGDATVGETVVELLSEIHKRDGKKKWHEVCQSYYVLLRAWAEPHDDPAHTGIAKAMIAKDADWALCLIIAPEGIYKLTSLGHFGGCSHSVHGEGCGGDFAEGAAKALIKTKPNWSASRIARTAVEIAASSTVFANDRVTVKSIKLVGK